MHKSQIVEIGGTFVGGAIITAMGYRFHAVHVKVEDLDESNWRSLDELRRAIGYRFTTEQPGIIRALDSINPSQSAANALLLAAGAGASSWMK